MNETTGHNTVQAVNEEIATKVFENLENLNMDNIAVLDIPENSTYNNLVSRGQSSNATSLVAFSVFMLKNDVKKSLYE